MTSSNDDSNSLRDERAPGDEKEARQPFDRDAVERGESTKQVDHQRVLSELRSLGLQDESATAKVDRDAVQRFIEKARGEQERAGQRSLRRTQRATPVAVQGGHGQPAAPPRPQVPTPAVQPQPQAPPKPAPPQPQAQPQASPQPQPQPEPAPPQATPAASISTDSIPRTQEAAPASAKDAQTAAPSSRRVVVIFVLISIFGMITGVAGAHFFKKVLADTPSNTAPAE